VDNPAVKNPRKINLYFLRWYGVIFFALLFLKGQDSYSFDTLILMSMASFPTVIPIGLLMELITKYYPPTKKKYLKYSPKIIFQGELA